jgi:signal transduction histidine kinase
VHLSLAHMRNELAQSNEQLIALNEEKNNLLSIAAHDLKNPIASIMTASVIIKKHFAKMTPDSILNNVGAIFDTARRMTEIIGNLLDINKIESGEIIPQIAPVDANDILGKVVEEYRERADEKFLTLELVRPSEKMMIEADAVMLRQVLDNLVSNAVKFSPHRSTVNIRIAATTTAASPPLQRMTDTVNIFVQNHTSRISEQEKQKLFSKFGKLSNRPTGGESSTGLGLFIVKRLVDAMQGKVWCETEDISIGAEKQTLLRFVLAFPLCAPEEVV